MPSLATSFGCSRAFRLGRSLAISILLLATAGWAEAPMAAEALAKRIDAHYNALRSVEVRFAQVYDGMGMHRVERGTLLLARGGRLHEGKMRWTYSEPAGKLFVFDGRYGYFYTPGQSGVQRVPAKELQAGDGDPRSPLALFLGHAGLTKQLSEVAVTPAREGEVTLSGVPRGMERRVARIAVTASPDGEIHELRIEETDGAANDFHFSAEHADVPARASDFEFTPPPGARVVSGMPPM